MYYTNKSFTDYCESVEVANEGHISDALKEKFNGIKKKYQNRYFNMAKKGLYRSLSNYNNVLMESSKVIKASERENLKEDLKKMFEHSKELRKRIDHVNSVKEVQSIDSDIQRSTTHTLNIVKKLPNHVNNRRLVSMIRNNEIMNGVTQQNMMYQQMFDQQNQLAIQEQQRIMNQMTQQNIINQQVMDTAMRSGMPMNMGGYMPNSAFGMF